MNDKQFDESKQELLSRCHDILKNRGPKYHRNDNVFDNFEHRAMRSGMSKFQVWSVYAGKHLDAIENGIKDNPEYPEGIRTNIVDAINYLIFLDAMLQDVYGPEVANDR